MAKASWTKTYLILVLVLSGVAAGETIQERLHDLEGREITSETVTVGFDLGRPLTVIELVSIQLRGTFHPGLAHHRDRPWETATLGGSIVISMPEPENGYWEARTDSFDASGLFDVDTQFEWVGWGEPSWSFLWDGEATVEAHLSVPIPFSLVIDEEPRAEMFEAALTIETADEPLTITPIPDQDATVGQLFSYPVEASGAIHYFLYNAPTGMMIDSATGLIEWTPDVSQKGLHTNIDVTAIGQTGSDTEIFNITVHHQDEHVYIPDPALKAAVEATLGITDPTPTDMLALTFLDASTRGIVDLTVLEYATNMTYLDLCDNQISDISAVAGLTKLTLLDLSHNQISDISALADLTKLTWLDLGNNQVGGISVVDGLTELSYLSLYSNQISDISALAGLTELSYLSLYSNQISNISALGGLTNLGFLDLGGNQISDISELASRTNLRELWLYHNQISDISALVGLMNLEWLRLDYNQISDISAVAGLTNLTYLDLRGNPLNQDACNIYIPLIRQNNPGIDLYDPCVEEPTVRFIGTAAKNEETVSDGNCYVPVSVDDVLSGRDLIGDATSLEVRYGSPLDIVDGRSGYVWVDGYYRNAVDEYVDASYIIRLGDISGNGRVNVYDASLAAQHGVELIDVVVEFGEWSEWAADVTMNGRISVYDASLIAQYSLRLICAFPPEGDMSCESASGLTMASMASQNSVTVTVGNGSGSPGDVGVEIPITVSDVTGLGIFAVELELEYDASQLSYNSYSTGTVTGGWSCDVNVKTPGTIKAGLYSIEPMAGEGTLLNIYFDVGMEATVGSTSTLYLTMAEFNEGAVSSQLVDGSFYIEPDGQVLMRIITSSLPDGIEGTAYSQTLHAAGGATPYTWSVVAGALPPGLSLASSTGVISGTPTAPGTYTFAVEVTDSGDPETDTKTLTIEIRHEIVAGSLDGWGMNRFGEIDVPTGSDFLAISANQNYGLALKSDGSIVGWGYNCFGQASPPEGKDFTAIAAGVFHAIALKADGSIVGWGANHSGESAPPAGNDFVAIAAGAEHSLALKSNGSIIGWGRDQYGQATPPEGNDFVAIETGIYHSLTLKADGSIVGWGWNTSGEATPPEGNDFVAIAAGAEHSLALKSNGSIVGWGDNGYGQATPPEGNDFVAISAGTLHSLALKSDGSVVGWGNNAYGAATPPEGSDFIAIAAGHYFSLAIEGDIWNSPGSPVTDSLSEALDTALSFTTVGSADWFGQTTMSYYGEDAAESGDISDDQESWMQTTVSGKGTLKFYWMVSSEEEYDFLEFYIDGVLQEKISGLEEYWEQMTYTISTSGSHVLEWRYMKDSVTDKGSDCGWVDKVEWVNTP